MDGKKLGKTFVWKIKSYIARTLGISQLSKNPRIYISKSANISPKSSINCTPLGSIKIGDDSFVNEFCSIYAYVSRIIIGKNVLVGPGTVMHTHHHNFEKIDVPIILQEGSDKPIIIGDDVWIGAHCTILGGVTIGDHSVIGAHSLVNRSIPPCSIAYGVPCRIRRKRKQ